MSKYSIARTHLDAAVAAANGEPFDDAEVLEAVIVTAVQDLIKLRGGQHTRQFLTSELDSISTDGVFDIARR